MDFIRKPTLQDLGLLGVLVLIWGSAFMFIKIAVSEISPLELVISRVALGFLVLLPWAIFRGFIWPSSLRNWFMVISVALLSAVIPFYLIASAEQHIDSGVAALLMGFSPLTALVISHFTTQDDHFTKNKLIGVLYGFSGITLLVGFEVIYGLGSQLFAQFLMICAGLCYVTSSAIIRHIDGIPPVRLTCLVLGIAVLFLLPSLFIIDPGFPGKLSSKGLFSVLFLGVVSTGLAYIFRYHLVRTIGLSYFSLSLNLLPVVGLVLGILFLNEQLTIQSLLATILILFGLFVANRS